MRICIQLIMYFVHSVKALEKIETYYKEMSSTRKSLTEMEDEKRRLETEVNQVIFYINLCVVYCVL